MSTTSRRAPFRLLVALGIVLAGACIVFSVHARTPRSGTVMFEGHRFDVVRVEAKKHRIELRWKDEHGQPLRDFKHLLALLAREGKKPVALTNAGIFGMDFTPLGLHVEQGRVLVSLNLDDGEGNFFLKPNGVFAVDGTGSFVILESSEAKGRADFREATQSGPLLVRKGALHPAFRKGSANLRSRSGIGVRSPNELVIAITNKDVNFDVFARLFRDGLGCQDALFLDGEISGLWSPAHDREDLQKGPFTAFIAVTERAD